MTNTIDQPAIDGGHWQTPPSGTDWKLLGKISVGLLAGAIALGALATFTQRPPTPAPLSATSQTYAAMISAAASCSEIREIYSTLAANQAAAVRASNRAIDADRDHSRPDKTADDIAAVKSLIDDRVTALCGR